MLRVIILGAAAGGGLPQWNCGCDNCTAARGSVGLTRSTQTSLAVSADDTHWFLINASPDFREQVLATPRLHPRAGELRHSPIAGVILTNGEVDALAGLLSMREGWPFMLYAHPRVLDTLRTNSIFNVLSDENVTREPLSIDTAFLPRLSNGAPSGLRIVPFAAPGKPAWYLEKGAGLAESEHGGDTLGLEIGEVKSDRSLFVLIGCARVTPDLKSRLKGAPLVLFDGTVWRDDEMIVAGLGVKTGQRMGHIAMSGPDGAIAALAGLGIGRKVFVHVNNSNPVLRRDSPQRIEAALAGWEIAADGMEFTL